MPNLEEISKPYRRLLLLLFVIFVIFFIGTVGFMIIEPEFSILNALYMTTITLSTVGFHEVIPLGSTAKIFTIFLIITGISTIGYGISSVTSIIVEGQLKNTFRNRKMDKKIKRLKNHIILCGHGRLGSHAARELENWTKPYLIIEHNLKVAEQLKGLNKLCIHGSAVEDSVLQEAGVERAYGLIAALSDDADNLFIALTARRLNKDLVIISRAEFHTSEVKLRSAGADKVLSPAQIAGRRMASMLINPEVVDFLDVVIDATDLSLTLQEFHVRKDTALDGVPIKDCSISPALRIIGLKEPGGQMTVNPRSNTMLKAGQVMIVLGEKAKLDELRKIKSRQN